MPITQHIKIFVLPGSLLLSTFLFSGCDSTFFGDAEPDLNNPFTRGTSESIQNPDLANPLAVIASQRYPGTLYALADEARPVLYALDDTGRSLGQLQLTGVTRSNWRDLALHQEDILILGSGATAANQVLRFVEPVDPPPFDGSLTLLTSQSVFVPGLGLGACQALGSAAAKEQASLLCGNSLYSFALNPEGGSTNAQEAGTLQGLPADVVDFSISPAGQFAMLTLTDQLRVGQSDAADWAAAFSGGGRKVEFDHDEFRPATSSFAFNGVLLHTLGERDQESRIFTIFNP